MSENKIKVEIGAVFDGNFKKVFRDAKTSLNELNTSLKDARQAAAATRELKKLTEQTQKVAQQTKFAKQHLENLKRTTATTEGATRRLNLQIEKASYKYRESSNKLRDLRSSLSNAGQAAKSLGVNTKHLNAEQQRLGMTIDRLTAKQMKLNASQTAGSKIRAGFAGAGRAAMAVGITAGIGAAAVNGIVGPANDLQESLVEIKARNQLTLKEFKDVEKLIRETAAVSIFTGSQVGEAAVELAKAGFTPKDLKNSLEPLVNFASGERISSEAAALMLSSTLQQFNLDADQSNRVLNVISKTVNEASLNTFDYIEAMKYLGATASALNIPLEDASALILTLSKANLRGGIATRAFQTSLLRLTDPTKEMQDMLDELTGEGYDVDFFEDGKFIGLEKLFAKLEEVTTSVDQERGLKIVSTIFGSEATGKILTVLSKGTKMYRESVDELNRSADENIVGRLAEAQTATVKGQFKTLLSVWDELILVLFRDSGLQEGFANLVGNMADSLFEFSQALKTDKETLNAVVDIVRALGMYFSILTNVVKFFGGIALVVLRPVLSILEFIARVLDIIMSLFGDHRMETFIKAFQGGKLLIDNVLGFRDVMKEGANGAIQNKLNETVNNITQDDIKSSSFTQGPKNVTISQSITVDGSKDPQVVGEMIAKITKQEIEKATFNQPAFSNVSPLDFSFYQ